MITPDRKRELAVEIGAQRANNALDLTPAGIVYRLIAGLDDIAPLPDVQIRELANELANLIRTGRAIVTFPQEYVGKGDGEPVDVEAPARASSSALFRRGARVRLLEQIGHCGPGCEGTVKAIIATIDPGNRVQVDVDGFGILICPPDALERIPAAEPRKDGAK